MADQNNIVRDFLNIAAKNPQLLSGFAENAEGVIQSAVSDHGLDLGNIDISDAVKAISPIISGDKVDVNAIANLAGELFGEHDKESEGGLNDILGALGNVFGDGDAHESKKNSNGGIDLSALGGIAASLFSSK